MIVDLNTPNVRLEKLYADGGYKAFGKKVELDKESRTWLREEINRRNSEDVYVFKSRAEKKRMPFCKSLVPSNPY